MNEVVPKLYLVTGGAGFIGSHLVEELVKQGQRVRVIDTLSTGKRENIEPFLEKIEFIEGDIRDLGLVRKAMDGVDYVLHQAAVPSVPRSVKDPLTTNAANVDGTLNILIAARDADVKRVVYAQTGGDETTAALALRREQARWGALLPGFLSRLRSGGGRPALLQRLRPAARPRIAVCRRRAQVYHCFAPR